MLVTIHNKMTLIKCCLLCCIFYASNVYAEMDIESEKNQIRKNSTAWNESFSTRNVDKLLPLLSEDVQMASAGGKWQTPNGTESFIKSLFERRPDITWRNEPNEIVINPVWKVAYEFGDWTESWTEPDGDATITRKYFSLWKQKNSVWLLQSMIFTPLNCSGASQYCKPHPEK